MINLNKGGHSGSGPYINLFVVVGFKQRQVSRPFNGIFPCNFSACPLILFCHGIPLYTVRRWYEPSENKDAV